MGYSESPVCRKDGRVEKETGKVDLGQPVKGIEGPAFGFHTEDESIIMFH